MKVVMHGRRSALAVTAAAIALGGALATGTATAAAPHQRAAASPTAPPRVESALLSAMNRARTARGRRPLKAVPTLRRPARGQSHYLVGLGTLDHDGPDGSPFWTRLLAAGFPRGRTLGENLAVVPGCGRQVAARTVKMWLNSPGHRANLLNPTFRWVGAGVAVGSNCSQTYVTADYGS